MNNHKKDAIIILGHGSRVPGAAGAMNLVADALKSTYGYTIVELCHMSRLGPYFEEKFEKCITMGATSVILIPYFLHEGLHMKLDIPKMMQEAGEKHPEVRLILGKSLGFDPSLVALVQKRIEESKGLCDVRELALPAEDTYPVPPGQYEFVPMSPEQANKWREERKSEQ